MVSAVKSPMSYRSQLGISLAEAAEVVADTRYAGQKSAMQVRQIFRRHIPILILLAEGAILDFSRLVINHAIDRPLTELSSQTKE